MAVIRNVVVGPKSWAQCAFNYDNGCNFLYNLSFGDQKSIAIRGK